jgi:hypothetical protein
MDRTKLNLHSETTPPLHLKYAFSKKSVHHKKFESQGMKCTHALKSSATHSAIPGEFRWPVNEKFLTQTENGIIA